MIQNHHSGAAVVPSRRVSSHTTAPTSAESSRPKYTLTTSHARPAAETIVSVAIQPAQNPVAMLVMTRFVLERDSRRQRDALVVLANAEPNYDRDHEARDEH